MKTTTILTSSGNVQGFIDHVNGGKRVRDKEGKYLARYDDKSNWTFNAEGLPVSQGDTAVTLLY
jgi:hypothetical protein